MTKSRYEQIIADAEAQKRMEGPSRAECILTGKTVEDALCSATSWPRLSTMPEPKPSLKAKAKGRKPASRNDLGQNKTESAYHGYLEDLKSTGAILDYWWDAMSLKIGSDCRYRTDFLVQNADETLELHEVKGHMEDDALVKLKVVAKMFPFTVVVVKKSAQGWVLKEVARW